MKAIPFLSHPHTFFPQNLFDSRDPAMADPLAGTRLAGYFQDVKSEKKQGKSMT